MNPLVLLTAVFLSSATLVALFILLEALFPAHVQRSNQTAAESPGRSFAVGAVNVLFFGAVALALLSAALPLLQVIGVVVAAILLVGVAFGLSGIVQLAGDRILPAATPLRRTIWAAILVIMACLTPYLGWFVLFPYLTFRGFGGWILGWIRDRRANAAQRGS